MKLLDRLGDRAGAMKIYDEFSTRLRSDLDVEPSAETISLANTIRAHKTG
jgi:DNA-binding SARP family transcriptional activator